MIILKGNQIPNLDIMQTNKEIEKKLEELSIGESNWWKQAEERKANRSWIKLSARIAFRVFDELKYQGITQVELAERLEISPQAVSKWLKGKENFTLESIFKLEKALGITLLTIPKREGIALERNDFNPKGVKYTSSENSSIEMSQAYGKLTLVKGKEAA